MKRQIQTNFWFLLPLLWVAFSGCESSLEFPQEIQPRLTIVSHLAPQSWEGQKVHVFVSQAPSDSNSFYTPSDLLVQVVELETDVLIGLDSAREDGELAAVVGALERGHRQADELGERPGDFAVRVERRLLPHAAIAGRWLVG